MQAPLQYYRMIRLISATFTKEMLSNPDPAWPHCHCASIALSPGGDLYVTWYAYKEKETCDGILIFARKPKGANKFDKPRRILSEMNSTLGNPMLFSNDQGRIYLMFVALRGHYWDSAVLNQTYSDDQGISWQVPETVRLDPGIMVRYPPIVRNNQYLLLPAYDEKTNHTVLLTTDSEVSSWIPVTTFQDTEVIQGCIVRRNEKEMTMLLRPAGDRRVCFRSVSVDDGRTWSNVIPTTLPNPLSGVAGFYVDDKLCAVYNHTREHQRYPLSLAYSRDGGTSWSDPIHIDETPHELSYPAFVVDDAGVAHGVYTFGRERIQYVSLDRDGWMQ